jgi:RNA polymerase sigma factor (TIGR02999 family)
MHDVTRILNAAQAGDPHAADQLLPLVYHELRRLAAQRLAREKPGQTLDATALVHEAYLRLVAPGEKPDSTAPPHWDNRRHFFAAAAEAMRRILVENARRKGREKRGGALARVPLEAADLPAPEPSDDLVALDEALTRLAQADAQAAELVKLRYFVGLSLPQAAEILGIAPRSADRLWAYARAWLREALADE